MFVICDYTKNYIYKLSRKQPTNEFFFFTFQTVFIPLSLSLVPLLIVSIYEFVLFGYFT